MRLQPRDACRTTLQAICLAAAFASPLSAQTPDWTAAWTAPPIGYEPQIRDALGRPFSNETARQLVRVGTAARELRVRLTNELGEEPLRIGSASIMRVDAEGKPIPASLTTLSFGGEPSVTIPARAPYLSDPVPMALDAGETVSVSIYYPDEAAPPAHAQMLDVARGDMSETALWTGSKRVRAPGIVSGIDVTGAEQTRLLVAFGDSITEGAGASDAQTTSWPAQLARLLAANGSTDCWAVVNAGISGNRLLHDGRGPNAVSRFDRDVLAVPGVTHAVLLEGINDIGEITDPARTWQSVTAEQIIGAYEQLLARAHARNVKLIVGTLLPYEGAAYASAEGEEKRQRVNGWIRQNAGRFDGLIDFDRAMSEPGNPPVMRLAEQIGDHLHPNDAGYTRMAETALPVLQGERCPAG